MGAPYGNQYALGKKTGRKGAGTERANYELLEKMFFEILDKQEIQNLLASGKHSIKDTMVAKAFSGNERFIQSIFNKLFPDGINLKVNAPDFLFDDEDNKLE